MAPTVFPIIAYSLTSATTSLTQLRDLAEYQLRPLLSSVAGVAQVQVIGGAIEEYRVSVDPVRLQAYSLVLDDVAKALSGANVISAVGRLEDHYKLYLVVSDTRLQNVDQIRRTILKTGANGIVELEDVATVEPAPGAPMDPGDRRRQGRGPLLGLSAAGQQQRADRRRREGAAGCLPAAAAPRGHHRQLVRPEPAGHRLGEQRARRDPDRHRPGGAGALA